MKSIMAWDLLNPSVLFGKHTTPSLQFSNCFIRFETFLTAEIDRLSVDHGPAGMAHGNIGMTVGILHQVFTASGEIRLGGSLHGVPRLDQLVEKIGNDDAENQLENHLSNFSMPA
jgi:hypothetical protein